MNGELLALHTRLPDVLRQSRCISECADSARIIDGSGDGVRSRPRSTETYTDLQHNSRLTIRIPDSTRGRMVTDAAVEIDELSERVTSLVNRR